MRKCFAFHSSSCLHWKPFCCARNSQENMRRLESKTFTYFTEDHQRYVLFHWCKKGSVACREGNYFYLLVIAVKISITLVLWDKWCKGLLWIETTMADSFLTHFELIVFWLVDILVSGYSGFLEIHQNWITALTYRRAGFVNRTRDVNDGVKVNVKLPEIKMNVERSVEQEKAAISRLSPLRIRRKRQHCLFCKKKLLLL